MKKMLVLLFALVLGVCLCACGGQNDKDKNIIDDDYESVRDIVDGGDDIPPSEKYPATYKDFNVVNEYCKITVKIQDNSSKFEIEEKDDEISFWFNGDDDEKHEGGHIEIEKYDDKSYSDVKKLYDEEYQKVDNRYVDKKWSIYNDDDEAVAICDIGCKSCYLVVRNSYSDFDVIYDILPLIENIKCDCN